MKTPYFTPACLLLCACLVLAGCHEAKAPDQPEPAIKPEPVSLESYRSPLRFEKAIKRFEQADAKSMPPQGAVLCVGSSSIRMWHDKLAEDLAPLTVIGRGFGGSNMNDLLHFADRVVIKYRPRAVVIYEGDNDIGQGIEPKVVIEALRRLLMKIDKQLPGCRVYILPAKPSLARAKLWPKMQELNQRFADLASRQTHITYIDTATPMLGKDGKARPDLFIKDGLHLNRKGYLLWRETIRPVLVDSERGNEPED